MYIYNYGAKGIEPELTGFAKTVWLKIQRRIDAGSRRLCGDGRSGGQRHRRHRPLQLTVRPMLAYMAVAEPRVVIHTNCLSAAQWADLELLFRLKH